MKQKRIQNKSLIKELGRISRCTVCFAIPVDIDHIRSRGAGGHDVLENLMPLCRADHTERHKIGLTQFTKKYWRAKVFLESHGWEFDEASQKWKHALNWGSGISDEGDGCTQ